MLEIISLLVGVISIVLAVVAMISSKKAEEASLHNFEKTQELLQKNYESTQKMLQENYDKTKELLAEIDKKAAVIDSVVQRNQEQMMDTITNIVNETVIPKRITPGEELGMQFLSNILSNPLQAKDAINNLGEIAKIMEVFPKNDK